MPIPNVVEFQPIDETWGNNVATTVNGLSTSLGSLTTTVNNLFTAWSTYTPTLEEITIGNGSLSGRYKQIGKTVHFRVLITFGSTTTMGYDPTVSVPAAMLHSSSVREFSVRFNDVSTTREYIGCATPYPASTSKFWIGVLNVTGTFYQSNTNFGPSTPVAYGTGDTITINGTYEAA